MKFFIDTANLKEIEQASEMGVLDGVTTNPSLMAKEGIKGKDNIFKCYKNICDIVKNKDVSAEVLTTTYQTMKKEALELAKIDKNIVVKVPMIEDGIKLIKYLSTNNIKTNCTLVFSVNQALLAAKAGATYVSPFIGRLDDISFDGLQLISEIRTVFSNYGFNTKILSASIRNPIHVSECAKIGSDVVTIPFSVIKKLFVHPLTKQGLDTFIKDAKKL